MCSPKFWFYFYQYIYQAICLSAILLLHACGAVKPYYSKENRNWKSEAHPPDTRLLHSVFLIGDGGEADAARQEPSLRLLEKQLRSQPGDSVGQAWDYLPDSLKSVLFLGDNIYLSGLSEEGNPGREEEERRIIEQMRIVQNWEGQPVFIPGNHDWNHSRPGGLQAVLRQQKFVEEYLQAPHVYLPGNGCPGPYPLEISDKLVLILLDSEWWLTRHERPEGNEHGCGVESELDLIFQLEDMLDAYSDKHIVLALHHPLVSNGNHGGFYSLGDHIFPLRLRYHNLYIPLPLIGSLYPLSRMYGISRQDLANPKYRQLSDVLYSVLEGRNNVVVAAGHEHSLQLHEYRDVRHIISGAATKETYSVGGRQASFVHKHKGFARLNFYENGETWVEFWEPVDDGKQGRLVFRKALYALANPDDEPMEVAELPDYSDSVKVIAANPDYAQGIRLSRKVFGTHYRREWAQPVRAPFLDMQRTKGGLSVKKRGGGQATNTLHLQDSAGLTYYFRSVDKDPSGTLPPELREIFIADFLQDQISTAHPYAALGIPVMAEAARIFHARPELYYMPSTPSLGPYLNEFGAMLGTLELKADDDVSAYENFGHVSNAINTQNLFSKLQEDNDHEVSQPDFLRARLFDILIGDWDRHEGQWRWAKFPKEEKGNRYAPVPKDRDQAFVLFDGIIPRLFSRWFIRKFQHFGYEIEDVVGMGHNSRFLNRRLLNSLDWEDWHEQVLFLQEQLSDSVIAASIQQLPPEIFAISGAEIIAKIRSRRDELPAAARKYYEHLSEYVDVPGSDKHELFEVSRLPDGQTRVEVYKTKKDGELEQKLYERLFDPAITREMRLYGLDGMDQFLISGEAETAIKLRIVGGDGEDVLRDESVVKRGAKTVFYYDLEKENNQLAAGPETRLKLADQNYINKYHYRGEIGTSLEPMASLSYNVDDGVLLQAGLKLRSYGFRRKPAADQRLQLNYAFNTGALEFNYHGIIYSLVNHRYDLALDANITGPNYVLNYFGQGNHTTFDQPIEHYRIRQNRVQLFPHFQWQAHEYLRLGIGPEFQYVDISLERNRGTIIDSDAFRQSPLFQEFAYMGGGRAFLILNALNDQVNPTRGIHWKNELSYLASIGTDQVDLTRLSTDFVLYISPRVSLNPTLALRFGGQKNYGDFLFYQSARLGNTQNLRGFRRDRFSGHSSFYQNTELRLPVSRLSNYFFSGSWGVYGFIDHGLVWSDYDQTRHLHRGYGPGFYMHLYEQFVISGSAAFSGEGPYFLLNAGFFFR
jgi:hypothetical protein